MFMEEDKAVGVLEEDDPLSLFLHPLGGPPTAPQQHVHVAVSVRLCVEAVHGGLEHKVTLVVGERRNFLLQNDADLIFFHAKVLVVVQKLAGQRVRVA